MWITFHFQACRAAHGQPPPAVVLLAASWEAWQEQASHTLQLSARLQPWSIDFYTRDSQPFSLCPKQMLKS